MANISKTDAGTYQVIIRRKGAPPSSVYSSARPMPRLGLPRPRPPLSAANIYPLNGVSGASHIEIAKLTGHRDLRSLMRYAHLSPEHGQALVDRLAERLKP